MIVRCPECGRKGKLDDSFTRKKVSCPECTVVFVAEAIVGNGKMTKWYYAIGDDKEGPVNQEEFDTLVESGTISSDTLVWCKGMDNWQTLEEAQISVIDDEAMLQMCSECENSFSQERMMDHEGNLVCERCKLAILHKKQEEEEELGETDGQNELKTGGVGSRLMAKIIDLIFMLAIGGMIEGLSRKFFPESYVTGAVSDVFTITLIINMILGIFYITWFVGKFGATPGKMVTKLKIVNADGSRVGYGQAFGRYCGEFIVVALTLAIGYFVALFDKKRRTLHDRLCSTRVVQAG